MKSEITKRWYFILLIAALSIGTFIILKEIVFNHVGDQKHPILLFALLAIELILVVFIWFAIIKQSSKLFIAVFLWASFNVMFTIGADLIHVFYRGLNPFRAFFNFNFLSSLLIILLIFIKNIKKVEPSQNISN